MNELDETLNRRRQRSEVAGAVFEVKSRGQEADITWKEQTSAQFTPRSSASRTGEQDSFSGAVLDAAKGSGKGGKGEHRAAGAELARLESPEGLRQRSSPAGQYTPEGDEHTEFAPAWGSMSPSLRPPQQAKESSEPSPSRSATSPLLPPGNLRLDPDLLRCEDPHSLVTQEQRDSEMSRATVDAGGALATAPASPASSARGLPTTSDGRSVAHPSSRNPVLPASSHGTNSEAFWGPTPQESSSRTPTREKDDRPAMSSSSYFRPYVRQQPSRPQSTTVPPPAPAPAPFDSFSQPFPKDKEAVLQKRLREASDQVHTLCDTISAAMSKPKMHTVELQEILKIAEGVQAATRLSDAELECIGWPTKILQQVREVVGHMEHWERCESEAKKTIEEGKVPLPAVVKALEGILVAWSRLSTIEEGPLQVEPGLQRRATSTVPLISALLDQTMALVRRKPDVFIMRQLEALLRHSVANHPLKELGVRPHFLQALQELDESVSGLPAGNMASNGNCLAAPDVVWRAVVEGDADMVSKIIHQGGLVSGRTCDPKGHSVLWDAIAFNNVEVALLLMRNFPPDVPYGVNLGELHPRNGNSLLHLASALQTSSPQAEGLFAMLFERMPEALRLHKNARGQTFLHIAAARLHIVVLKFAAVRGLESLFDEADAAGWSPRRVLHQRLAEQKVASEPSSAPESQRITMPDWCPLAALQPPGPGSVPAFSDVVIEVEDEARGKMELHAHCAVLGGCSPVLHKDLQSALKRARAVEPGDPPRDARAPVRLPLDPAACSSMDVATFAVRFLYTGNLDCAFGGNARLLLQLVRLGTACGLPPALRSWALRSLLECLDTSGGGAEAITLMREAKQLNMPAYDRCFVARRVFCSDATWEAVEAEQRGPLLELALDALEPFVNEGTATAPAAATPAPLGTCPLGGPGCGTGLLSQPPNRGALGAPQVGSGILQGVPSAMGSSMLGSGLVTAPTGPFPGGGPLGSASVVAAPLHSGLGRPHAPLGPSIQHLPPIQEAPIAVPSGGWW